MSQDNLTQQNTTFRGSHVQIVDDEQQYAWPKGVQAEIKKLIAKYPKGREASAVIPLLKIAQKTFDGWLPTGLMNLVAETLNMPPVRVYEVASFYDMFYTKPVGKHVVRVCTNVSCMVRGCYKVLAEIEDELGIKAGTTSDDGLVTLEEFECLGACCEAPMMMIDDHYHTSLTNDKARELMKRIKNGDAPTEATK